MASMRLRPASVSRRAISSTGSARVGGGSSERPMTSVISPFTDARCFEFFQDFVGGPAQEFFVNFRELAREHDGTPAQNLGHVA